MIIDGNIKDYIFYLIYSKIKLEAKQHNIGIYVLERKDLFDFYSSKEGKHYNKNDIWNFGNDLLIAPIYYTGEKKVHKFKGICDSLYVSYILGNDKEYKDFLVGEVKRSVDRLFDTLEKLMVKGFKDSYNKELLI